MKYARYIKTKDKIIDLERYKIVNIASCPYIQFYDKEKKFDFELSRQDFENSKYGYTIEELCDGFVSVFTNGEHFFEEDYEMALIRASGYVDVRKVANCFGYIKTDKRLIYVAKMNGKGELELL